MAGIYPNVGKNLNVKQLNLNATAKVDTQKPKGTEPGDAIAKAVWVGTGNIANWKEGDVVIGYGTDDNGNTFVGYAEVNSEGKLSEIKEQALERVDAALESDRGDYRKG